MLDCSQLTWTQMSEIVHSILVEMKNRNPIGVNMYAPTVKAASDLLDEIAEGEAGNFTSESGPKEPAKSSKVVRRYGDVGPRKRISR